MAVKSQEGVNMKDIKGFEGLYSVTEEGKIYSHSRFNARTPRYLKGGLDKDGYRLVTLCKDGKHYTRKVHRLVAEAFLPLDDTKAQVNHIDGFKDNNYLNNLEWCDSSENQLHAINTLKSRVGKIRKPLKISIDDASEICEALATGLFKRLDLARHYNVSRQTIDNIANNVWGATIAKGK